jgi:hypothetical protein
MPAVLRQQWQWQWQWQWQSRVAACAMSSPRHFASESAAWNWLWHRFQRSTRDIAAFLLASASWCRQRRRRALRYLDTQQRLPHRLRVEGDDTAIRPRRKFRLPPRTTSGGQRALDFACMPAQPERGQLRLLGSGNRRRRSDRRRSTPHGVRPGGTDAIVPR